MPPVCHNMHNAATSERLGGLDKTIRRGLGHAHAPGGPSVVRQARNPATLTPISHGSRGGWGAAPLACVIRHEVDDVGWLRWLISTCRRRREGQGQHAAANGSAGEGGIHTHTHTHTHARAQVARTGHAGEQAARYPHPRLAHARRVCAELYPQVRSRLSLQSSHETRQAS